VAREARVIARGADRAGERSERAEVCVIGSGAGGAVVAAELAAAGRDVVLLEQGPYHTSRDFDQREDSMLPRLFEDAAMRATDDGAISILQGRGVGGSTVHNLCYCFRAPAPILRLWEREHGVSELASLDASFERVERTLSVKPILDEELNPLNRALKQGAELLGYHGLVAQHNRTGCVRSGYCILGCSYDAKQSMLVTYVPKADSAGARIFADSEALRIESAGGGARRVVAAVRDARGRVHGELAVHASAVVVSAGAIASPLLLARSGLGGESGQLGRNLHLHPSVIATGLFREPLHAYYGIPQAYYIDEFIDLERDPHAGYVLMPIAGLPALTAANLPGFGRSHFRWLRELPRMGGLLALLHDRSAGSVSEGRGGRPSIQYQLEPDERRQLGEALKHVVDVLWAAGAERVLVPYFDDPLALAPEDGTAEIDRRGVREGLLPLASTHPQSTCRMGGNPRNSVVGSFGELHHAPGVFVADMSVFPTSLGAPPQITTAALADRTAHHILSRWSELAT
jgi:choline dehydrogenase-like flavoprotein